MRIHKEGHQIIIVTLVFLAVFFYLVHFFFPDITPVHLFLYLAGAVFFVMVVRFFRVPDRPVVNDQSKVYSGADGKVVVIEVVEEKEYFRDMRIQVSVFMSPLNVHLNWLPLSGTIKYIMHNHGSYFIASHPKSSEENERNTIVLLTEDNREIMMRQIAGTVARRIICHIKTGEMLEQGTEIGFIRFGSRFDIFLPLDAKVQVQLGQKVTGCETVIALLD